MRQLAQLASFVAPKPVALSLWARVPKKPEEEQSHASFLYQASYFGLTRQPYLVSLWQLDLERAESRGPPLDVERKL